MSPWLTLFLLLDPYFTPHFIIVVQSVVSSWCGCNILYFCGIAGQRGVVLPNTMRHIFHRFRCFSCLPGKDPRENTCWKLKRGSLFNEREGKKLLQFDFTSWQKKKEKRLALKSAWKPPEVVEHNCFWPCRAADNDEGSISVIFIPNMGF